MKTLIIEHTAPFQGLPELVADAEGLFAREGLQIAWANTNEGANHDAATDVLSPKGLDPFRSHGRLLEQGKADMYNACEWGNYCRVQDTAVGSRQLGRRGIVTFAAIVVAPDSPIYTPQQLAYRKVGVPFYFGTHYLALHMLEGFLTREQIVVCSVPHGSRYRLDLLMRGEIEGTTLTEPYVTLAEKTGCRVVCSAFYHGTQVGTEKIDVGWHAYFAPAGTPRPIIEHLSKTLAVVSRDPAIVKTLGSLGIDAVNATGDELAQTIQADIPLFRAALDAAGLLRTQTAR